MKKLNLNLPKLSRGSLLSRAEMKKVSGGTSSGCIPAGMSCGMWDDCCEGLVCDGGLCMIATKTIKCRCMNVSVGSPPVDTGVGCPTNKHTCASLGYSCDFGTLYQECN